MNNIQIFIFVWSLIGILSLMIDCKITQKIVTVGSFLKRFVAGAVFGILGLAWLIATLFENYKWSFWNKKLF